MLGDDDGSAFSEPVPLILCALSCRYRLSYPDRFPGKVCPKGLG